MEREKDKNQTKQTEALDMRIPEWGQRVCDTGDSQKVRSGEARYGCRTFARGMIAVEERHKQRTLKVKGKWWEITSTQKPVVNIYKLKSLKYCGNLQIEFLAIKVNFPEINFHI